jgi:hypothetical protein
MGLQVNYEYNPGVFLYAGAKYGTSWFRDEITYEINSSLWEDYKETISRNGLRAQWGEVIAGSESKWKGNFYLGFIFRFKILIDYDQFEPADVYTIPGYGRTMYNTLGIINLYIKYRIPVP